MRKRWFIIALVLVFGCILAQALSLVWLDATLRGSYVRARAAWVQADDAALRAALDDGLRALAWLNINAQLYRPLLVAGGGDGCTVDQLLDVSQRTQPLLQQLTPLIPALLASTRGTSGVSGETPSIAVADLRAAWAQLRADVDLDALAADLAAAQILRETCTGAQPALAEVATAVADTLVLLDGLVSIPWDTVLADDTCWLVVLNNSDELRATGGFTTAFVELHISSGLLTWTVGNSYAVDNAATIRYRPRAPLPMQQYMEDMPWWFRDANWSPDHPEAAGQALRLYALDRGRRCAGLVTFNFSGLQTLFEGLPPVAVNGGADTVSADNVLDFVRYGWGEDGSLPSSATERKDYLARVFTDLAHARLEQITPTDARTLVGNVRHLLERRDLMLYAEDADLATTLARLGWDGALRVSDGDYLMVVDSNLGYNKVDPLIERHYQYEVDLSGSTPQAQLTLVYTHTLRNSYGCDVYGRLLPTDNYWNRMVGCFWNYVRVLTPNHVTDYQVHAAPPEWFANTRNGAPAHIDAVSGGPYEGFGTMLVVPVAETRDLHFAVRLDPAAVPAVSEHGGAAVWRYELLWQHQPGLTTAPTARLAIQLPPQARVRSLAPASATIRGNRVELEGAFVTDWHVVLVYE